jgi:DNA-directed RNA polymerase subunit omega
MQPIPVNELYNKIGSVYKLVVLAALRAIELNEGAAKLVDAKPDEKPVNVALQEILEGKVAYKEKEKEKE